MSASAPPCTCPRRPSTKSPGHSGSEAQRDATPWLRHVSLENAFADLNMPLHPGALRYYEEIGLEIPEELRPPE